MRPRASALALCAAFLASTLAGCGGAVATDPPEGAKAGPPPGTSAEFLKVKDEKKKK